MLQYYLFFSSIEFFWIFFFFFPWKLKVRRKALSILNERATSLPKEDISTYSNLFIGVIEILERVISSDDSIVNKQTALLSIEMLAKTFARGQPQPFLSIIPSIVSLPSKSSNLQVIASCLVCLGTLWFSSLHSFIFFF